MLFLKRCIRSVGFAIFGTIAALFGGTCLFFAVIYASIRDMRRGFRDIWSDQ